MRDPKRIPKILQRLRKVWEAYPDLRLGQLIENVFPNTSMIQRSSYYKEDEDFMKILEEFYKTTPTYRFGGKEDLRKILKEIRKV